MVMRLLYVFFVLSFSCGHLMDLHATFALSHNKENLYSSIDTLTPRPQTQTFLDLCLRGKKNACDLIQILMYRPAFTSLLISAHPERLTNPVLMPYITVEVRSRTKDLFKIGKLNHLSLTQRNLHLIGIHMVCLSCGVL